MRRLAVILFAVPLAHAATLDLSGTWGVKLDPGDAGVKGRWFATPIGGQCRLPGSLDTNGLGTPNTRPADFAHLARKVEYTGAAWFQREVLIPKDWRGKRVELLFERCHWTTHAWLDERDLGEQVSLCTAHLYDLGTVQPGRHRLTLCVDNRMKVNVGGWAHSVTEETQTNWNGVIGRMELRATDPVWIERVQVYPDPATHSLRAKLLVGNATGGPQRGSVALACGRVSRGVTFIAGGARALVEADLDLPADTPAWDEFHPELLTLTADLSAGTWLDRAEVTFGLRKLEAVGRRLVLNGRTIFLRGTLECCIFPRTGFPPTDEDAWLRILRICREYGLNHLRFHSWCPPEAAFAAADRMGFLYHVELPQWVSNVGQDPPRDQFVTEELERIVAAYGNHPSFGMLCMGNELAGDPAFLQQLVALGKELDARHLYTSSTAWSQGPGDQYDVGVVRGLRGPGTDHDFRAEDARYNVPVVSHEVGQWTFFPDLAEIAKYDGVLEPRNFLRIRDDLAKKGLLDRAPAFTMASGRWSAELYKEEIEVLLRTPGHGGFQLLDLHDFPGQGTSLIGILDPFWDSKGIVTPAWWRRFCSPTVPLLRVPKRVYTTAETLTATAEVAHFGPSDLEAVAAEWTASDGTGLELGRGMFDPRAIPTGGLTALGGFSLDLAKVAAPTPVTIRMALPGTEAVNDWDVWVYPATLPTEPPAVLVTASWEAAKAALSDGARVLLTGTGAVRKGVQLGFSTVFWSPVLFPNQPGTMGLMYDPKHPALAAFPADGYTDWQWYDVLQRARALVLTDLPRELRPVVQVVDNFARNEKLALAFECRVGEGRLLVCAADLEHSLAGRPAARQLRSSLLAYAGSDRFTPDTALTVEQLETLLGPSLLQIVPAAPTDGVVLRVKAAVNVPELAKDYAWEPKLDEVVTRADGFGYEVVSGATWRDTVGAAWHHGGNLLVRLTVPKGFTGQLYAHFSDWNNLNRVAEVWFEGRELGTLDEYNGPGKWVVLPITTADSADGKVEISARPTVSNTMITEIVVAK